MDSLQVVNTQTGQKADLKEVMQNLPVGQRFGIQFDESKTIDEFCAVLEDLNLVQNIPFNRMEVRFPAHWPRMHRRKIERQLLKRLQKRSGVQVAI
jgi:hypothetical protein